MSELLPPEHEQGPPSPAVDSTSTKFEDLDSGGREREKKLEPPKTEASREGTARLLAFGALILFALFAGGALLYDGARGDAMRVDALVDKVLLLLGGFVGTAFGFYFRDITKR